MSSTQYDSFPGWEFEYHPISEKREGEQPGLDFILATERPLDVGLVCELLKREGDRNVAERVVVEDILSLKPVYWKRIRLKHPVAPTILEGWLRSSGLAVRYITSANHGSMRLGSALPVTISKETSDWGVRRDSRKTELECSCWSQGPLGVNVDWKRFGGGAGTRFAVIDDDAAQIERTPIDREVLVNLARGSRAQPHGTMMIGWAVGTDTFRGIAPDASPRLYMIPKPDVDVFSLPLAIVRAVADGADVVLCPSYLEGSSSPMLDDALEFAVRVGRGGLGTIVIIPTGRQASSSTWSTHVSWSLGLGEPASDPRVLCIAPGSPGGRWFLWCDRRGRLRPFANRGPAVQFLAPGDDMVSPLHVEKTSHAESSGASGVAAGVVLNLLAINPILRASNVAHLLRLTAKPPRELVPSEVQQLADPWDVLPLRRDPDGHDAKHGYGSLDAQRACLAAVDPLCLALLSIGEEAAALRWFDQRRGDMLVRSLYSFELGRWLVRQCLEDDGLLHSLCVWVRHMRLVAGHYDRLRAHGSGALLRQLVLMLRAVQGTAETACSEELGDRLGRLIQALNQDDRCVVAERVAWRLARTTFQPVCEPTRRTLEEVG